MTLINAGKQARYRERALRDPDRLLLTRVRVLIGPRAAMDLVRIRKRTGWTSRGLWKGRWRCPSCNRSVSAAARWLPSFLPTDS